MKCLIIETAPLPKVTHNMHVKISYLIKDYLNANGVETDLCSVVGLPSELTQFKKCLSKKYDILLKVYSSWYIHKDRLNALLVKNKDARRAWMTQEYEISIFGDFKPIDICLANFDESVYSTMKTKFYKRFKNININSLILRDKPIEGSKKYGCVYYGRYREDRSIYFEKYFSSRDLHFSTHKKNLKDFQTTVNKINCKIIKPLVFDEGVDTLSYFTTSLYIEDVYTHTHYNNLGTRFYEAINNNVVPLFDVSCMNTISRSGYEIPADLIIDGPKGLLERTEYYRNNSDQANKLLLKLRDTARLERISCYQQILQELCHV